MGLQMRRGRRGQDKVEDEDEGDDALAADRQFVVALARGLGILTAFRIKDGPLGNRELAERTGVPAATVSRLTHTLTRLGYLSFDPWRETYDLGGSALALGHLALARLNIRRIAQPLMQQLADASNANVGLGVRDRLTMLYAETCEGSGPVGLRLQAGSRIPIGTTAMGRAYLCSLGELARKEVLQELQAQSGTAWPEVQRGIEKAAREIQRHGFCTSVGEWQKDIHGVAVPLVEPATGNTYAINLGGPAYMLKEADLMKEHGPRLLATRDAILAKLRAG